MTWYGLPKKFERIKNPRPGAKSGEVEIVSYNPEEISRKCRRLLTIRDGKTPANNKGAEKYPQQNFPLAANRICGGELYRAKRFDIVAPYV